MAIGGKFVSRDNLRPVNDRTWRQILRAHEDRFLTWLATSGYVRANFRKLATDLATFLISRIESLSNESPDAAVTFWNAIPSVRACCGDLSTFEQPLAAEAYAYVHFLERYRRTWRTLEHLTKLAVLPLGSNGVRVLDIGAGPAHSSYATADYYAALSNWARALGVPELQLPGPTMSCLEQSESMVRFFHHFSEFCRREGPFHSIARDFAGLDLASLRRGYQRQNEAIDYWDPETSQYETMYDPVSAHADAQRLYQFRLLILSNFLTLHSDVARFESELRALFSDLRAGAVALLLGGTGDSYQAIYEQVATLATESGLREANWHSDRLGDDMPDELLTVVIKETQHRVYRRLVELVGSDRLPQGRQWPDYWSPTPSRDARSRFALRVFRRGRWPK